MADICRARKSTSDPAPGKKAFLQWGCALRGVARIRLLHLRRGAGWTLDFALCWLLVEAQSLKDRRAHLRPGPAALSFVRPLRELDFGDQFRLHKMNWSRAFYFPEERTALGLQRMQPFPQRRVRFLSEAAA